MQLAAHRDPERLEFDSPTRRVVTLERVENAVACYSSEAYPQGIEKKIQSVVTGFAALGFFPDNSCEGHLRENGHTPPWVNVGSANKPMPFVGQLELYEQLVLTYRAANGKDPGLMDMWDLRDKAAARCEKNGLSPTYRAWLEKNQAAVDSITHLVCTFNFGRDEADRVGALINTTEKSFRVAPLNLIFRSDGLSTCSGGKQTLLSDQKLMNEFGNFLKELFISGGPLLNTSSRIADKGRTPFKVSLRP